MSSKTQPKTMMAREMEEQPGVLRGLLAERSNYEAAVRAAVPSGLSGISIVARGSSDNAGTFGRYVLELATRVPVSLMAPSLHTLYQSTPDLHGHLVIAVSQSGRTPEVASVMNRCREAGASTLAITNGSDTPLEEVAHVTLPLDAGTEEAVPATKTFTASLAVFAMLAVELGQLEVPSAAWARLPSDVERVLGDEAHLPQTVSRLDSAKQVFTVSRGLMYPIALEAALKLKETALVNVEGFSTADLRHGPMAVLGEQTTVITFAALGPAFDNVMGLAADAVRRGANVMRIDPGDGADLSTPGRLPEPLQPIPATVRAQQLALHLALHRGLDPDRPSGLSKVTATH